MKERWDLVKGERNQTEESPHGEFWDKILHFNPKNKIFMSPC